MTEHTEQEQAINTQGNIFPERKGYPGVGQSFGAWLIILGVATVIQAVIAVIHYFLPESITSSETFYLAQSFLSYALAFSVASLVLIGIKVKKERTEYRWFPAGNINAVEIIVVVLLTVLMGVATEPLYKLIPSIPALDDLIREELQRLIKPHTLSFGLIAVLPAIFEETLFRGVILDGLLKRTTPTKAILLSSFLFGLIHLNPMQFVGGVIAGIFLGWVYWRTKSLTTCMVIHGMNNGLSFFLTLKYGVDATTETLVGSSFYIIIVAVSAVLFLAGCWWLSRRWSKT